MCDEDTEADNEKYLITRRDLGLGAGAAFATVLVGCRSATPTEQRAAPEAATAPPDANASDASAATPRGRMVTIATKDGTADAFFVAPASGRHPGVIVWPDVAGLRDSFTTMATRLATEGYAVLAVNPYYRAAKHPVLSSFEEWRTPEGKAKIGPLREALTADAIASDGAAFVAWLDRQAEVDTSRKIASTGYCMGGPFTLRTAAAAPDRVGLVGSFHGGGLVTDAPDSPHLLKTKAAALVCIAQNDDEKQPAAKTTLQQTADAAQLAAEIEVYPAQHGWCVTDSPVYDETQAERAWSRLLAMLAMHVQV
ncbi:MAG TPA: dienelactone hydrolase family protein [Nannocystaceae bacterium]|nr:dienelactone hydrolase family protein [Nannocystaceae bacterium]